MNRINRSHGQILPVVLAVIALAITAILLSHRVNRAVTQETRLVNAADAAAYSAASWTARRLNLIAYTNRAMIANHIAVGHLVAYISWLRYVDQGAARLARYTSYLPYVGTATRIAQRVVRTGLITSERMSWGYINGVDALHTLMQLSQVDARRQLQRPTINAVMQRVANQYDQNYRVNQLGDLSRLPTPYASGIRALLVAESLVNFSRVQTAEPGEDRRYFNGLLNRSIHHNHHLRRWLEGGQSTAWPRYGAGGRNWDFRIPLIIRFRKQGATNRAPLADAGGWRSRDRLQVSTFEFGKDGWGWSGWDTIARGRADADRIASGYSGVNRYTRLRPRDNGEYRFRLSALVTAPIPGITEHDALQSHLSMAEVIYRVPDNCGATCPNPDQPPTLFNPYWQANLTATDLPGLR